MKINNINMVSFVKLLSDNEEFALLVADTDDVYLFKSTDYPDELFDINIHSLSVVENTLTITVPKEGFKDYDRFRYNYCANKSQVTYAYDIDWDVDSEGTLAKELPKRVTIPYGMTDLEEIGRYLTDTVGFFHWGFKVKTVDFK